MTAKEAQQVAINNNSVLQSIFECIGEVADRGVFKTRYTTKEYLEEKIKDLLSDEYGYYVTNVTPDCFNKNDGFVYEIAWESI